MKNIKKKRTPEMKGKQWKRQDQTMYGQIISKISVCGCGYRARHAWLRRIISQEERQLIIILQGSSGNSKRFWLSL